MIGWNHGSNVVLVVTIAWSPSLPFLHSFYRESGQWCCPWFLHLMFLWFAAICTPLVCPVWGRWSKRIQVQGHLCPPVCQHQVQAIERHSRWANRAISSAPNLQPSTANWQTTFEPPTVFGRGSNAIFHQAMRGHEKCGKAFRLASGSYSIETYRICSKFSIRSLETQKKAGMGTYLRS